VAEEVRNLQDEIEKMENEIRQVDEKIDEYQHSKVFVETVITENKLLSEEIKQMVKNYIK
jgi:prefoldin subunit 5